MVGLGWVGGTSGSRFGKSSSLSDRDCDELLSVCGVDQRGGGGDVMVVRSTSNGESEIENVAVPSVLLTGGISVGAGASTGAGGCEKIIEAQ